MSNVKIRKIASTKPFDEQFERRRDEILSAASEYAVSGDGKIYYVSPDGDDTNDGLSPETPWKTVFKVNDAEIERGSVVLFKRGCEWNRQTTLVARAGCTYSAYGEGEKPQFSNYVDANEPHEWIEVAKNIWVFAGERVRDDVEGYPNDESIPGTYITSIDNNKDIPFAESRKNCDVGVIVFTKHDGSEGWGVKVTRDDAKLTSVNVETVSTGFGTLTRGEEPFVNELDLKTNLEFYCNPKTSRMYLYWDQGNPADSFKRIRLVLRGYLVGGSADNVIIDNLKLAYVGCHGVSVVKAKNYTLRNCELGWLGGSIQLYGWGGRTWPTRLGEGIQNWGNCDGYYVINNYMYQVYDGAISSQMSVWKDNPECIMKNFVVKGNALEYNTANFETWLNLVEWQTNNEKFKFEDFDVSENMIRRAGWGFGSTRHDAGGNAFCGSMGWPPPIYRRCNLHGNVVWDSRFEIIGGLNFHTKTRYNLYDNTIVHKLGGVFADTARDFDHMKEWDRAYHAYDDESLSFMIEKEVIGENDFCYVEEN